MKGTKLLTKPEQNAHLVKAAFDNAQEKYGKAWHLLAPGVREALVYSEALLIISMQHERSAMSELATAVIREWGERENA